MRRLRVTHSWPARSFFLAGAAASVVVVVTVIAVMVELLTNCKHKNVEGFSFIVTNEMLPFSSLSGRNRKREPAHVLSSILSLSSLRIRSTDDNFHDNNDNINNYRDDISQQMPISKYVMNRRKSQNNLAAASKDNRDDTDTSQLFQNKFTLVETKEDYIKMRPGQRLVCIGDVHGDYWALQDFLETARVYDRTTGSWIGGDTVVVQCGDVLDRASEELSCLELLCHLSHLAAQSGGRVICLVGNHEVLNSLGDFDYASDDDTEHELVVGRKIDYFLDSRNWRIQYGRNHPSRWASYEPNGVLSKSLLSKMKIAVRVGNTVCIHAGLRPSHLRDYGGIEGMNRSYRNWICDDCGDDDDESTVASVKFDYRDDGGASILSKIMTGGGNDFGRRRKSSQQALRYNHVIQRRQHYIDTVPKFLTGSQGPVWMRDYSSPSGKLPIGSGVGAGFYGGYSDEDGGNAIQKMMDETLLLLGADRMVMGHTIQSQINSALNGKAWRIDVGASRGCGSGKPEVLEIIHAGAASNATDGGGTACTGTDIVSVLSSQNKTVPAIERSLEKLQEKRKEALF